LKTRWKRYRKALKRCQRKFTEGSVHDSRIETRRMLSSLELVGTFLPEDHLRKSRRLLKRHLDTFAELRDTQVQLLLVAKLLPKFPDMAVLEVALFRRERRCIKQARKRIKRIETSRLAAMIDGLRAELRSLPEPWARQTSFRAVEHAFAEVVLRRQRIRKEDPLTIHKTRVAFKHFRYMVEGLREVLPGLTAARLRAMQAYQTMMGQVQDREVFLAAVRRFAARERVDPAALGRWSAEIERQKRMQIARYLKRAEALNDFWPPPAPAEAGAPRP
jgi:CHAD domain-containing protein